MRSKYEYMNKLLNVLSFGDFVHTESRRKQVRSERRIRTPNGGQDGGDEKVIACSDISVAREGMA